MKNVAYGKTIKNVRKHRIIKLVNNDKEINKLVSKPNYHSIKWFSENLLAIEMKAYIFRINNIIIKQNISV